MRHRNKINSLGRKAAHRKKTMSSLATALILNKRINTTVAKAKALRSFVEPLITKSKEDSTHSRRVVFAYLRNKYAVSELFREISQKVAERPGGYTRILKTGFRKGDGAEMCFIELVDYNTHMLKTDEETQQKRTRRGRRRGKKEDDQETEPVAETQTTTGKDDPVTELTETDEKPDTVVAETPETATGVAEEAVPEDDSQDVTGEKVAGIAGAEVEETPAEKQQPAVSETEEQSPVIEEEKKTEEAEKGHPSGDEDSEKPSSDERTTGDEAQKPEDK